jgi:hypothetical protein
VIDMARLQSICVAAASLWGADVRLLMQKSQQEIEHAIECGVAVREPAVTAAIAVCNAFHTAEPYEYLRGVDTAEFRQRTFAEVGLTAAIKDFVSRKSPLLNIFKGDK